MSATPASLLPADADAIDDSPEIPRYRREAGCAGPGAGGDLLPGSADNEFFVPDDAYDELDEVRASLLTGDAPDLTPYPYRPGFV